MTDREELAALLHEVATDAYGQRRWAQAPWPTDMYDWIADRLIAAGVRLDRTPAVGDEGLRAAVQAVVDLRPSPDACMDSTPSGQGSAG